MLRLFELMTPAPVTISSKASLREAVELLTATGVNALPVLEGDQIVGLLSAQGIVAFESTTPGVPAQRDDEDVWDDELPGDDIDGELPTSEYFTDLRDDVGADVVERIRASNTPEWDVLGEHTVEEAMTPNPPRLRPLASARLAARMMRRTGSHGVLVVENGKLTGIVTTMDIARAFGRPVRRRAATHPPTP